MDKLHELRRKRAALVAEMKALAIKEADMEEGEALPDAESARFTEIESAITALDGRVARLEQAMAMDVPEGSETVEAGSNARTIKNRTPGTPGTVHAAPAVKLAAGIVLGGCIKMIGLGGGNVFSAAQAAEKVYGAEHPVTKALSASVGTAGGFVVPPDYVAELIEVLRPMTVVRSSGPRLIPMPRGTMTLPRQSQAASASYGGETAAIPTSQQSVDQIVASYKKLTALVPVSNDLMRYSDPAIDALVRDDLAQVIARAEDLAFIRGDGTMGSPKGFLNFLLPGNTISSTSAYTLGTAANEIGGMINKLESSNIAMNNVVWLMAPRVKNYLLNVQNALGLYPYRDEMRLGLLFGFPFKTTTQIPINLANNGNTDCSEVYLVDMAQAMLLDSMSLEISVSREGSYVDTNGIQVNVFQQDQTLIRAIAEHDFQMRHVQAIAVIKNCRWAPAIS